MEKEWIGLIQGVGFPAAVAFFVLWRVERTLRDLIAVIVELRIAVVAAGGLIPRPTSPLIRIDRP